MPTIVKPQVLVFQEFRIVPTEITQPLRAHISGPLCQLHRHSVAAEKALINLGAYDYQNDAIYDFPQRQAGSIVDAASVRLFVDDALLLYFEDLIDDGISGHYLVKPVATRHNWIRSQDVGDTTGLAFKANGTSYPRSDEFLDRDVNIGDVVHLRGVTDPDDDCVEVELWTTVAGFAAEAVAGVVDGCHADTDNAPSIDADTTIAPATAQDGITATADSTGYDGLVSGYITETYTITVTSSSIAGCNAARLRIRSASGTDDQDDVQAADFGAATDIGTRGLTVTFTQASTEQLIVGQVWVVRVHPAFVRACCEAAGDYDGAVNDVYIVEVTRGGLFDGLSEDPVTGLPLGCPQVTVTTSKGADYSGPTEVTGEGVSIPIGTHGVTMALYGCTTGSVGDSVDAGETILGLRKGDKFYVTVVSGLNGRIGTLILRDDLPVAMQSVADLDLSLYIKKDIEVTINRLDAPPNPNYTFDTLELTVLAGITAYDATWALNGVPQPMALQGGSLYCEYREFLHTGSTTVGSINDVADLDTLLEGQLDPENTLKWGVYRALQNSGGTAVKFTTCTDPSSLSAWTEVLNRIQGRNDLYNLVPLTFDKEVLELFMGHVNDESSAEAGNWKAMFGALQAKTNKMLVGQSAASDQLLHPTSTDGEVVLATLGTNPEETDLPFTRLQVPAGNGGFITYGVQPGDVVRFLFTIDAWGTQGYREFTVDEVLSENTLLLLENYGAAVNQAQRVEIWHTFNTDEVVTDLREQAQAFANRRVCMVWPDYVGTAGVTQEGYFLAAALAGLASGVVPQQGLTNVEVAGFDDFARSTEFLHESQLNDLMQGGVWIVTTDQNGTPHTRKALTTLLTSLSTQEEMVRRNVDSMSYLFLGRLAVYIGRCNATPTMLAVLKFQLETAIKFLANNGTVPELGSQLISGSITTLEIHPLLADRVYCVLDLVVPYSLNNIELHLVI